NVKNLLALLSGSHKDDISSALKYADRMYGTIVDYKPVSNLPKAPKSKPTFILLETSDIYFYPLKKYLNERKIPLQIANQYCKEVKFLNTKINKEFKAVGFKAGNCWELRNSSFKCSVGTPKKITIHEKQSSIVEVYTGFFDFLSSCVLWPHDKMRTS